MKACTEIIREYKSLPQFALIVIKAPDLPGLFNIDD